MATGKAWFLLIEIRQGAVDEKKFLLLKKKFDEKTEKNSESEFLKMAAASAAKIHENFVWNYRVDLNHFYRNAQNLRNL